MTSQSPIKADAPYLELERNFYLGLLELTGHDNPRPFIESALQLVVGLVDATQGYLEFFEQGPGRPRLWYSYGFPEEAVGRVQNLLSHGIISEAVASERIITTSSALLDPRFRDRASVRQTGIHAVICAPIGSNPPKGVLYLHNALAPSEIMSQRHLHVERFARYLAPLAEHVVLRHEQVAGQQMAELRTSLYADDLLGDSEAMLQLLQEVRAVAALDVSVLLSGETGTGKSQLARVLHRNSRRASGPFIELNCATLQDQLFENELFGAMAGSHSTATKRADGKVAAAKGGTLFLDEISELSLTAQAKLLQLLQSREYFPLGSAQPVKADVRVVVASNLDLTELVQQKRFRQDLYYRLQVVNIRLPSLRERTGDITILAQHFCKTLCTRHGLPNISLSPSALRALESAEWPGNVRELANRLEEGLVLAAAEGLTEVGTKHLFRRSSVPPEAGTLTFQEETRRFQKELLQRVLVACNGNVSEAARQLDLTRAHVYNLIKSFGLERWGK